jgi:predicted metal-dependent hydrolase
MAEQVAAEDHSIEAAHDERPAGRTPPLEPERADELFRRGVALFNGVRYWHAHEAWEELWRAAPDDDRDFYQGLIQVAAGLLHLQRRNARGARNKLSEGLVKLRRFTPTYQGIFVNELVGVVQRTLDDLEAGFLPYLVPPVIRFAELEEPDWSR